MAAPNSFDLRELFRLFTSNMQEAYRYLSEGGRAINALFVLRVPSVITFQPYCECYVKHGAVGSCQAEAGTAAAMASSAAVELMGGTPQQSLDAASTVLMNMLGLVCDPVKGLVEYPCQNHA